MTGSTVNRKKNHLELDHGPRLTFSNIFRHLHVKVPYTTKVNYRGRTSHGTTPYHTPGVTHREVDQGHSRRHTRAACCGRRGSRHLGREARAPPCASAGAAQAAAAAAGASPRPPRLVAKADSVVQGCGPTCGRLWRYASTMLHRWGRVESRAPSRTARSCSLRACSVNKRHRQAWQHHEPPLRTGRPRRESRARAAVQA
eukprot:scaffold45778_cov39-Phaeocystis_antarctica.AAC.2